MLTNDYPDTSGYQKINLTQSDKFKHLKFINAKIFANLNKAKTGKFIFDLGTGGKDIDVILKKVFLDELDNNLQPYKVGDAKTFMNSAKTKNYKISKINISAISIQDITAITLSINMLCGEEDPIDFGDKMYDGYLGWRLFQKLKLIIDFRNNVMYIKKSIK